MKKIHYLFLILLLYTSVIISQNLKSNFPKQEQSNKTFQLRKGFINANKSIDLRLKNAKLLPDSLVIDLLKAINPDSVKMYINGLQNFGTRYAFAGNKDIISNWIKQKYLNMGFTDVVLDTFLTDGVVQNNIVATLPGKNKDEVCIIGGHFDSYSNDSNPDSIAPGADDNASGASAALEIARVIMQKKYVPECTIKFINFDTEELGLYGSDFIAKNFSKTGLNLKLMINADMISYSTRFPDSSNLMINYYDFSEFWTLLAKQLYTRYTKLTPVDGEQNSEYSDSYPFWRNGYQTVYVAEDEFSPFYHSTHDTIGNYNMPYCAEIMKGACALLVNSCHFPGPVQNFKLKNVGDGKSILASWNKATCNNFKYFKVYIGNESKNYDSTFITTDTNLTIYPNTKSNSVYVAVSVVNDSENESSLTEQNVNITSSPIAPYLVLRKVSKSDISIFLYNNDNALLFAGNNIYRADSLNGEYIKINSSIFNDSIYIDKTVKPGKFYYYRAKSVYSSGTESELSNIVNARLATLDKGIGLVITANDGSGSIENPSLNQLYDFFSRLLTDFPVTKSGIGKSDVSISDIGDFSSVIWYNYSNYDTHSLFYSMDAIDNYLKIGGKLLLSTQYPTTRFNYYESYPNEFEFKQGDFVFDFFKVGSRYYQSTYPPLFKGAVPKAAGYNNLQVDTTKTTSDFNWQVTDIETFAPNSMGRTVYSYISTDDSCSLNGRGVGVEYMGNDYKTILLSFPLYYMKADQVKEFLRYVLINKFNEPVAVNTNKSALPPADFSLKQNYPNPFNPVTNINFDLPVASKVKLVVYNSLGQMVNLLCDNIKPAGAHSVQFNAGRLASGVYFYSLTASPLNGSRGTYQANGKMLLLK